MQSDPPIEEVLNLAKEAGIRTFSGRQEQMYVCTESSLIRLVSLARTGLHRPGRWNIEETEKGVRICRGLHESFAPCDWEEYEART
jgi:hypothetical protein